MISATWWWLRLPPPSVAFSLYVTRDVTPPAVSAATSFVAECPTTTQYEISHVGPQRSMQITCEGIAK